MSLMRGKKSQGIPSVESFENDPYARFNMVVNGVVNGVQNSTFRYHYKNSRVDYTHKDKKKSQLQVLWIILFTQCKSHIIWFDIRY